MTAISSRLATMLALTSACTVPASAIEPGDSTAAPQIVAEPGAAERPQASGSPGPLEIELGDRLVRPTAFAPSREVGMTDEPTKVGWSAVTGEFVVCVPGGGAVCDRCDFHHPGRQPQRMGVGEDCGSERVTRHDLDTRLAFGRFALANGNWIYGAELVLVVAERQGEPDVGGIPRGVVEIGVRRRSSDRVAVLDRVEHCFDGYCAPDVHIDAIAPSPDGRTIAVLAHTFAGEFTDTHPLRLLDADELAAAVDRAGR
jgi:hypothetical protein